MPDCEYRVHEERAQKRGKLHPPGAQGRLDDYLWDGWKDGLEEIVVM